MASRGVLLALEGVDGCGKSTQAELLAAALRERGLEVVLTCEPTDSPLGQQIREYFQGPDRYLSPKEELNLFMADRREHVAEVIDPALAEGKIVITDRYYYSSVAYQGALGLDPDRILAQNEVLSVRPDLAVILTLPVAQALARLSGTPERARQVSEDPAYLEQVATIYAGLQGPHLRHLDASGSAPGGSRRPAEPDPGIPGDRRARGKRRLRPGGAGGYKIAAASSLRTAAAEETRGVPLSRLFGRRIFLTSQSPGVNNTLFGPLTQLVEYLPFKQRVVGSNPTRPIKYVPIV